ncbi:ABC TRANSPORTER B FAMILY PROTEIN [Salix purpurea]|uniref:ABC TRANSPORTER B FAMILY PROTEIN n=1 Tax=Salix purpurea TaxID=77065 RepID=A0A9Q0ZHL3_SALPP|nr:ABC TRANSPORTER B FAMILY PROTEIN [Salix purpurea]
MSSPTTSTRMHWRFVTWPVDNGLFVSQMPNFLMNVSTFIGCYIMAFILLWRLAIVMFPFILLLVIPGVVYGKILIGISRKMKQEYSKAETIAEQAISSARTIYAFVGETKAIAAYSAALQLPLKLGLKQGMAKGLAVGSNAVIFAVWSFMSYYGSRLVMYHGSRGGNVFNAGACVMVGGLSFGAGLSNMKYFADACSAGERIMEFPQGYSTQVMEIGSHDELIENEFGMYASLVRLQQTQTDKPSENVTTTPVSSSAIPIMKANNRTGSGTGGRRLSPVQISRSANSVAPSQVSISTEENAAMEEKRFSAPSFRRLLALNLPEWKQASFGCLGAILFGAVQPVYAFVLGSMISVFFLKDHDKIKEKIRIYSFFFLGLTFFSLIINVIQHYNFAYMGEHLTKRIRERMLSKILTFEVGWFDQDENSSGSICSRLTKDANVVRSVVGDRMALVVQTMSAVTIAWTMGLVIAWRLAIVMIAVQPVMIACYYTRSVLLKNTSRKAIKAQDESSKLAADAVSNLRTIAAFSSQERILKMLEKVQEGPRRENIRQSLFAGVGLSASRSLMSCTLALDYWYGGKLIAQGCLTYKAMFETFLILVSTGHVIADAGSMTMDLSRGSDSIRSVFALLGRCTKIEPEDPDVHVWLLSKL